MSLSSSQYPSRLMTSGIHSPRSPPPPRLPLHQFYCRHLWELADHQTT